jgi:hypothetical protein
VELDWWTGLATAGLPTARYHRPGGWDFGVFILVAVKEGDQDQTG